MSHAGFKFFCLSPDIDETPAKREKPVNTVKRLAYEKAVGCLAQLARAYSSDGGRETAFVIVSADTEVVDPRSTKVLGKPIDGPDAVRMLKKIQGRRHQVVTGFCVLEGAVKQGSLKPVIKQKILKTVKTDVWIRSLNPRDIERYVNTGEGADKAGAYGAQGVGMALIERIEGSYTNVIGLPVAEVAIVLEKNFKLLPDLE